jgi:hypothetical protein
MREKLNESKAAQIGLVAVLVVVAAFFFLGKGGGGSSGGESGSEPEVAVETGSGEALAVSTATAPATGMGEIPTSVPSTKALPRRFTAAYGDGDTVALLVVHDGGIDDAYTKLALKEGARAAEIATSRGLASVGPVTVIVVPAKQISRYASVTLGLDVNQVPALIVMRPKALSDGVPQASVLYGYQSAESIVVALLDASYNGPERSYHPG